jgi:hypothetical protein
MKICPVGAELFHADGRTDMRQTDKAKLIVAFCNFGRSTPKKQNAITTMLLHVRKTVIPKFLPLL